MVAIRTLDSHRDLNGTTIPMGEKFTVGGVTADGPHDPVLPAREVVNCRCRLMPVIDWSHCLSNRDHS